MNKLISLVFLLIPLLSSGSGTVVGNGGDPVFEFMEAARASLIGTVNLLLTQPEQNKKFCESQKLSSEQIQFCREFFMQVAPEILRLNQGNSKTLFVLREESLFVEGPDGNPMIVAARTALGPEGPIELHRDSVKTILPTQGLFLLTHEFQHKVTFQGRNITDNETIGPFATGRDLLDQVSTALVSIARKNGKVGSQFGIRDMFDCQAYVGETSIGARLSSSRLFQTEDLMSYETSIGKNPNDNSFFVPVTSNSSLNLRIVIAEPNNCGDTHAARKTLVQIVHTTKNLNGDLTETIKESRELETNPICPDSDPQMEIASPQVRFTCKYYGSEGTTSSAWPLGRPQQ